MNRILEYLGTLSTLLESLLHEPIRTEVLSQETMRAGGPVEHMSVDARDFMKREALIYSANARMPLVFASSLIDVHLTPPPLLAEFQRQELGIGLAIEKFALVARRRLVEVHAHGAFPMRRYVIELSDQPAIAISEDVLPPLRRLLAELAIPTSHLKVPTRGSTPI